MSDAGQSSEHAVAATAAVPGINRNKLIRYALFVIVMGLYTLPLLGVVVNPPSYLANSATGQLTLLVIHEFAEFARYDVVKLRLRCVFGGGRGILSPASRAQALPAI